MSSGEDVFVLRIALGRNEIETGGDVAEALRATADKIDTRRGGAFEPYRYGYVANASGRNVGEWEIQ